jgi:hypothetical protein
MAKQAVKKHRIQKQTIEIHFDAISGGLGLQNQIADVFYEKLLPELELLFDEFTAEKYHLSFDRLEIDCGILSQKHWEEQWVQETLKLIRNELLAADKIKIDATSSAQTTEEAFLFFLQHGYLPWNSDIVSIKNLEQITPNPPVAKKIRNLIQTTPQAADRLVYSFSVKFSDTIISLLANVTKASITSVIRDELPEQQIRSIHLDVIKALCSEKIEAAPLTAVHTKEITGRQNKTPSIEKEGIYIHNAGLVILHPFLPELFNTLNLLSETTWKNEIACHTAVRILEYLVTGSDECAEFDLPFNKIICGMQPGDVLKTTDPLPAAIASECDKLLSAVIQHWSALKNTGIPALRETFLQRDGKLVTVDNGWLLQVEPQAVDVLLSRLPWGIGTTQLPWMKGILYTEWGCL